MKRRNPLRPFSRAGLGPTSENKPDALIEKADEQTRQKSVLGVAESWARRCGIDLAAELKKRPKK